MRTATACTPASSRTPERVSKSWQLCDRPLLSAAYGIGRYIATASAAQYYARSIEKVLGVSLIDFGIPEAMWHIRAKNFAAIVTMDAHGNSLHAGVEQDTGARLEELATV